ncbi:hypothetical protein [Flavobacterium aestivum]|uniref:hypothetical protein n=1 Tax=Flavobacterium aestivum TaxID=3003257 RepID=UPI002482BA14|nr:hypothetical protein [Flavobacterium aestivum]
MKKIYLLLIIIIHFNVFSQENLSNEGYFNSKNDKEYNIYRDTISNKYFLINDNGKIKLKNYKYIGNLSNQILQCLDDKNQMIFLDTRFKKLKKTRLALSVCGTVNTYEYNIEKK